MALDSRPSQTGEDCRHIRAGVRKYDVFGDLLNERWSAPQDLHTDATNYAAKGCRGHFVLGEWFAIDSGEASSKAHSFGATFDLFATWSEKMKRENTSEGGENGQSAIWLHLGSKEAGPKIAAIFSVLETCRRFNIPVRRYLADILPGLANRSIQSLAELTPAAYAARIAQ